MYKDISIKDRVVNMYDVDTGTDQDEIIKFLDKQMKVRFHSVVFSPKCKYMFLGKQADQATNSLTVSKYQIKNGSQAVLINP